MPELSHEPEAIVAGDTLVFRRSFTDFPAGDGWSLDYVFKGTAELSVSGVADGDEFVVTATAAQTATLSSGGVPRTYALLGYVTKGAERYTVYQGELEVCPDPANLVAGYDGRTHEAKVLEALEAVIEGRATRDQSQVTINGRTLVRIPPGELLSWRDKYRQRVNAQKRRALAKQGRPANGSVRVRFTG